MNGLNKVDFTDKIWDTPENQNLIALLKEFEQYPHVASDAFGEITDFIWDAGTCYPMFFVTVPYLIEIVSGLEIETSKDLWSYLGCWIATQEKYRDGVSEEVLACFDSSLKQAEESCIEQIISVEKFDETDAQYLYASLFAFAKHRLGYMTMSGYKDDLAGTSIAECPQGHLCDVTVYNSGIVAYEEEEKPHNIGVPRTAGINCDGQQNKKWMLFEKRIQREIDNENTSEAVKSYLELSKNILKRGVDSQLDIKHAFSLYGSLLYCNGSFDAAMRVFHGLDEIICPECGEKFIFADGWCEDKY